MKEEATVPDSPITKKDLETTVRVLGREDVRNALRVARANPRPLELIDDFPTLSGLTLDESMDLVTALQRVRAISTHMKSEQGVEWWYNHTGRVRCALQQLDRHCTADSKLYETIRGRYGARFLVQSNVEEAVATAILDGVEIDERVGRELLLTQRQPRNDGERLIVNHFRLSERLPQMIDRPWEPGTIIELYTYLTEGVTVPQAPESDWERRDVLLRDLMKPVEESSSDACEHPAVTANIVRASISGLKPFPAWNGMLSRIAFRFVALKLEYPVLGFIPVSLSELALARAGGSLFADQPQRKILTRLHEHNGTPWLDIQVTLMAHALEQLLSQMKRAEIIDQAVQEELREDENLNHRQRSVLGRALRVPDATFRISYHRTTHAVGYATAHRDFAELVERGYLTETLEGRAKVFRIGSALQERVSTFGDVGRSEDYDVPLPEELLASW